MSNLNFDNNGTLIVEDKKGQKRKNMDFSIKEGKLTIICDLTKIDSLTDIDISGSGKTYLLASSGGNLPLSGEYSNIKLGLNLMVNKDYVEGRREILRQKELWKAETAKAQAKDDKIASLESELIAMKALLEQVLAKK